MDTLDRRERRRFQNRNAQRRFRWKKASEDCSAKGTAEKHVTSNEMSPLQPSPRVVNQPTEVTGDAVASHARFTAENKRPTVADQAWAQLAYQGRHSPSLASSSSSGTPSMATSTSGMVAQRASCDASARCLSRDDNYMITPSLPFMPTLLLPDFPSPVALGGPYDQASFLETSAAELNEDMVKAGSHASSAHFNNNSRSMNVFGTDYELACTGNWGNQSLPTLPSSAGTKKDDNNNSNSNDNDENCYSSGRNNRKNIKNKEEKDIISSSLPPPPLLDEGGSSNDDNDDNDDEDEHFRTSLQIAAEHGHESLVGMILASGAQVDEADSEGNTALHLAAQARKLVVVRLLLAEGADPNAVNARGWTPVHLAVSTGSVEIVETLVRHGGDLAKKARCTVVGSR
ncbi:hypothetical protein F5Y08DRAFT_22590 [Xylaria arbuscula]|nr:hypothetical protein F5Y08DRAFT_22590 [Xylaria arbuscula]